MELEKFVSDSSPLVHERSREIFFAQSALTLRTSYFYVIKIFLTLFKYVDVELQIIVGK